MLDLYGDGGNLTITAGSGGSVPPMSPSIRSHNVHPNIFTESERQALLCLYRWQHQPYPAGPGRLTTGAFKSVPRYLIIATVEALTDCAFGLVSRALDTLVAMELIRRARPSVTVGEWALSNGKSLTHETRAGRFPAGVLNGDPMPYRVLVDGKVVASGVHQVIYEVSSSLNPIHASYEITASGIFEARRLLGGTTRAAARQYRRRLRSLLTP